MALGLSSGSLMLIVVFVVMCLLVIVRVAHVASNRHVFMIVVTQTASKSRPGHKYNQFGIPNWLMMLVLLHVFVL